MAEKECHSIREVKRYMDAEGHEILEFIQVFGKNPEPPIVKGVAIIRVQGMSQNGQKMPPQNIRLEWTYPDGTSVKKAFETFEDAVNVEIEKLKKEQQEQARTNANQIVRAGAMSPLLGADGKVVKL